MEIRTVDPATGAELAAYPVMSRAEAFAVARDAHAAFPAWRDLGVARRAVLLPELARVLRQRRDPWAELMSREMGKAIVEARAEIEKCAWLCEVYAEHAEAWLADETVAADGLRHLVAFEPLGVVFSIMPWNYPWWQALRFAVPGLVAGNVSLLKHASNVTGSAFAIEEAFRLAGFPADVFRTITPDYGTVDALIADDLVQGVSLTGSTDVGRAVGAAAGRALKKVVLELGGSDPFLVLEDADVDVAARGAVTGRFMNAGQSCIASKRFLVCEPLVEAFAARFAELASGLVVGDPQDEATQVGAIVNEAAMDELLEQIEDAQAKGARVLCGGARRPGAGLFLEPTVIADARPGMRVVDEEVFGPVAPVIAVKDEDEAVAAANASEFGLGGSVWTRDLERGVRVARRVESGTLFVNSFVKSDPRMPFGGVKNSGLGRELAAYGLKEFVNVKGISVYEHR